MSYRLPFLHQTARIERITQAPETRPATLLRPAQAFFRDCAGNSIRGPDRDPAGLDLLFAKQTSFAGRETGQGKGQRQQVQELSILLLQFSGSGWLVGHGVGSSLRWVLKGSYDAPP